MHIYLDCYAEKTLKVFPPSSGEDLFAEQSHRGQRVRVGSFLSALVLH